MGCPPWVLDPELPEGGAWWISRIPLFEAVAPKVEEHNRSEGAERKRAAGLE
jgi:hypothetical protein